MCSRLTFFDFCETVGEGPPKLCPVISFSRPYISANFWRAWAIAARYRGQFPSCSGVKREEWRLLPPLPIFPLCIARFQAARSHSPRLLHPLIIFLAHFKFLAFLAFWRVSNSFYPRARKSLAAIRDHLLYLSGNRCEGSIRGPRVAG